MIPIIAQIPGGQTLSGPYIEIAKLSELPDPLAAIQPEMMAVAFVICVAGWLLNIYAHKDSEAPELASLLRLGIVVALIAFIGPLRTILTDVMYYFPRVLIANGSGINSAGDKIRQEAFHIAEMELSDPTFFSFFKISFTSLISNVLIAIVESIALLGSLVLVVFYFIQHFAVLLGFAGMPIALACFTIPAMKDKATNYMLSVMSVLSWPFFLVVVNIAANYVFLIADGNPLPSGWGILGNLLAPAIAAMILLAGSFSTPLFSYFLWTTGGGYLPPGSAGQVMNTAGSMGGLRALRGLGKSAGKPTP